MPCGSFPWLALSCQAIESGERAREVTELGVEAGGVANTNPGESDP